MDEKQRQEQLAWLDQLYWDLQSQRETLVMIEQSTRDPKTRLHLRNQIQAMDFQLMRIRERSEALTPKKEE